jgi:hypothetical protein
MKNKAEELDKAVGILGRMLNSFRTSHKAEENHEAQKAVETIVDELCDVKKNAPLEEPKDYKKAYEKMKILADLRRDFVLKGMGSLDDVARKVFHGTEAEIDRLLEQLWQTKKQAERRQPKFLAERIKDYLTELIEIMEKKQND